MQVKTKLQLPGLVFLWKIYSINCYLSFVLLSNCSNKIRKSDIELLQNTLPHNNYIRKKLHFIDISLSSEYSS